MIENTQNLMRGKLFDKFELFGIDYKSIRKLG